jgi:GR25 family glycosyltransferase involved in LPS biosynthesis
MIETEFIKKMLYNYDVNTLDIVNNGNILNNYTEQIYVINLDENIIRRNYILTMMKKYGICFKLVIVKKIDISDYENYCKYKTNISIGELGCGLSHLYCLKDIIKNKYNHSIIFEDDIIFHKNFEAKFFNIIQNRAYDFLLLGACDFHFSQINYKNVYNQLYKPNKKYEHVYGAHAIYYSLQGAEYMFNYRMNLFAFFDYDLNNVFSYFKNTSFICYPNLVVTELSTSDNNHSYELFSKKEKTFYVKCFTNFNFKDYHFIYLNLQDSSSLQMFTNYKDYICYLFKKKYDDKKNDFLKKFINRIDFDFFSWEDIQKISCV